MTREHLLKIIEGPRSSVWVPIQCTCGHIPLDLETFRKTVRGTWQGATRLDLSRLSSLSLEDLFNQREVALPIVEHYGSLLLN